MADPVLDPHTLYDTRFVCQVCHEVVLAISGTDYAGLACRTVRCGGTYAKVPDRIELALRDYLARIEMRLTSLDANVQLLAQTLATTLGRLSMTLDELRGQVEANTTVSGSAVTLINGMSAKVAELSAQLAAALAANDPAAAAAAAAAIDSMGAELAASASVLSAAITANTPNP